MSDLPSSKDVENLNEDDAVIYIEKVITLLGTKSNIENENELRDLTSRLCNSYFDYQDFVEKIGDSLVKNGFCKMANDIFSFLIQSSKYQSQSMENLSNCLINYTDCSIPFASDILKSKIMISLINFCIENQDSITSDMPQKTLIDDIINIIHNVARFPANNLNYEVDTFKNVLMKFIKHDNSSKLGVISILTLSYIIDDKEIGLLDEGINVIGILINRIRNVNSVDHRSGGFTVKEMLNSLRCLSANDNIKTKILDENGIPLLFDIFTGNYEDDEKVLTLKILWNLCFNPSIKKVIVAQFQIEEVILQFKNSNNKDIKLNCDGILFDLKNNDKNNKLTLAAAQQSDHVSDYKFDVFISYSHEYKNIISKIESKLRKSNFKVWLDSEQMFGSVIEAMANGIKDSRIFILAMSKAYIQSPNCRHEAEYACKLQKPIIPVKLQLKFEPPSWLGFIVGMQMYYEFSERRNELEQLSGIITSIHKIIGGNEKGETESEIISPKTKPVEMAEVSLKIRNWKRADVMEWLLKNQLKNFQKTFKEMDGSLLEVLIDIRNRSPEYFNQTLKNEFKMKFFEVLKFHKAINGISYTS